MDVIKFSEYKESLLLPITDIVIDEKGNVHNGDLELNFPINKGRLEIDKNSTIKRIVGDKDGKDYPIGIDKNGNAIVLYPEENTGRALDKQGNPIPVLPEIKKKYKISDDYYYAGNDYYQLLTVLPTGWVNVKIDMEIVKRVRKYAKSIGTNNQGHSSFISKLKEFKRLSKLERKEYYIEKLKRTTIQKELACILMLHHINEIKDFFNPSQAGFLFESFIAGLIPNSRVKEDNSKVDIKADNDRYQLKFMDYKAEYVSVTLDDDSPISLYLEYYMVALKYFDKIELYIIDGVELGNQLESGYSEIVTDGMRFKVNSIKKLVDDKFIKKITLDLSSIDDKIKNLGENIKSSITDLYEEISKFNYNVETIITGVDKNGKVIKGQDKFNEHHDSARRNLAELASHLENLVSGINR
jgi:hypothetical protein